MIVNTEVQHNLIHTLTSDGSDGLVTWIAENWSELQEKLYEQGSVLLRQFDIEEDALPQVLSACGQAQLKYQFRSTPRTAMGDKVYTTTEYPEDRTILQHNENAYSNHFPSKLWFQCVVDDFDGGQTPLTDSKAVLANIPADIKEEFSRRKLCYVRHFNPFIDLNWQEVFCTEDKSEVEAYCRNNDIAFSWEDQGLTTRQICEATQQHPVTGETVWFNQAHIFHPYSQGEEYRQLLEACGVAPPRNVVFADNGDDIPEAMLQTIIDVYDQLTVTFDWQKNDVLIIDNFLAAHGRKPFSGSRKILVAMS